MRGYLRAHKGLWTCGLVTVWLITGLGGCPTENEPPNVSAMNDIDVETGSEVTLTATASDADGDALVYLWEQISGTDVTLADETSLTTSFTAPEVAEDTTLEFRITVVDGNGGMASDSVAVTVIAGDVPNAGRDWYLVAVAASTDDLGGTMGDQIAEGGVGLGGWSAPLTAKAMASTSAAGVLDDVLDAAGDGEFDDMFLEIDADDMSFGTGLYFVQRDLDNDYERTAVGFPAWELSTRGLVAEQLGLPIRIRADGPIVAISQETRDSVLAVVQPIADASLAQLEQQLQNFEYPEEYEDAYEVISGVVQELMDMIDELPEAPNADGVASYSHDFDFEFDYPQYQWVPASYDEETDVWTAGYYELVDTDTSQVDISFELDIELLDDASGRWEGATSVAGEVASAGGAFEQQTLEVSVAIGYQRLTDPQVVWVEPGDGTKVEGERLTGEWVAEFTGDLIGMDDGRGYLYFEFDEDGDLNDLFISGTYDDGSYQSELEKTSVLEQMDVLRDQFEDYYDVTIPPEELRVTLDADGNLRVDLIVTDSGEFLQEAIEAALNNFGQDDFQFDLSGLPDLPLVSFIGEIDGDTITGDLLVFTVMQPAEFDRE